MRCPICHREFDSKGSATLPFCSERCRTIDLGRWLGEAYHLPVTPDPDDDEVPNEQPAIDTNGEADEPS